MRLMLTRLRDDPAMLTLISTLSTLALLVLIAVLWITSIHLANRQAILELEPRIARQLGLLQAADPLKAHAAEADSTLRQLAISSEIPENQASTELLQKIRKVFEVSGMSTQGVQALPIVEQVDYQVIPVNMTAQGGVSSLALVLEKIKQERPFIHIERLAITPVLTRRKGKEDEQFIRVEMKASVVRAKS